MLTPSGDVKNSGNSVTTVIRIPVRVSPEPAATQGYRRPVRRIRLVIALIIALGWTIASALPALAGSCAIAFNGVDAARLGSPSSPLELTVSDHLTFGGIDPAPTSIATIEIRIATVVVKSASTSYDPPSERFMSMIDLDDVAPYGVGLMKVTGITDGCSATIWLRVGGRFPLTTLAGITAAGLTIGGLTGQLGAIASRRNWSRTRAGLGGIVTGTGAAALGQQLGRLELSYFSATLAAAVAATLGVALAWIVGPIGRDRRSDRRHPARKGQTSAAEAMEPDSAENAGVEAATRPDRAIPAAPYWCYVLSEVEVLDLDDHSRVVGRLTPGTWYLARRESGPWVHVSAGDGVEGWMPRDAAHRQG